LQNLLDRAKTGELDMRVELVIGSRPNLVGIERARAAGLPTLVLDRRDFPSTEAHSREIFARCDAVSAQLVVLAGWLTLLGVPDAYQNKIMNIHPALLPSFGGPGMYGLRIQRAVLDHGCKLAGCTVHFIDNQYDHGPIIVQRSCPVLDTDTPETLAHRIFDQELLAYPMAVQLFQQGKLKVEGRKVRIVPSPCT
jgi:formyltetrahydrofolate-dependent phosphoribosylglycinamide formyltransferase